MVGARPFKVNRLLGTVLWGLFLSVMTAQATAMSTHHVTEADKLVEFDDVAIEYRLSTHEILARQMLVIHYRIESNDSFISLQADIQARAGENYQILEVSKQTISAARPYRYDLKVLYSDNRPGSRALRIPDLRYSEGGKQRYQFRFAPQTITVKPLPPYLPPYIPLAPISITTELSHSARWYRPLFTHDVYYWTVRFTGINTDELSLPDIRSFMHDHDGLVFLPVESRKKTQISHDQFINTVEYTVPLMVEKSGLHTLPALDIQYFDPYSRRLVTQLHSGGELWVLAWYWQVLLGLVLLILSALITWYTSQYIWRLQHIFRAWKQAQATLQQASQAVEILQAMRSLGHVWGWRYNMVLSDWANHWIQSMGDKQEHRAAFEQLAVSLYAAEKNQQDISGLRRILAGSKIKQAMLCIMASRKPVLK